MLTCAFFGVGGVVSVDHGLRATYEYCVITGRAFAFCNLQDSCVPQAYLRK